MSKKIVLLHYRYTPAVAGVELILEQHARLFADAGHDVVVLAASGRSADPRVRVVLTPELQSSFGENGGEAAIDAAFAAFKPWGEWADVLFVHNVLTMPFALPATVALWRLSGQLPAGRIVNWVHDLAAVNPDYATKKAAAATSASPPLAEAWRRLSQRHPKQRVVAISEWRARQFREMSGESVDAVIPNGISPAALLGLSPELERFVERERLLAPHAHDLLLFQPARILRRKNIALGLHLIATLRQRGFRARLLVTAAPDGHNPDSTQVHAELLALRRQLRIEHAVTFISEHLHVTQRDLAGLYQVCDALWFPSKQEGFGLPLLEGVLHRMTIFCANLPPMNAFGLSGVEFLDIDAPIEALAEQLLAAITQRAPLFHARRDVLARFAWDAVWPRLDALLHGGAISPE